MALHQGFAHRDRHVQPRQARIRLPRCLVYDANMAGNFHSSPTWQRLGNETNLFNAHHPSSWPVTTHSGTSRHDSTGIECASVTSPLSSQTCPEFMQPSMTYWSCTSLATNVICSSDPNRVYLSWISDIKIADIIYLIDDMKMLLLLLYYRDIWYIYDIYLLAPSFLILGW